MASSGLARFVVIVAATVAPATAMPQQRDFITPGLTLQPNTSKPKPFVFSTPTKTPPAPPTKAASTTTVICGMTVIHPDPTLDPEIVKTPPDTKTTFTLKTIRPTVCAASASPR